MHFSAAISSATLTRKSWRLARSRYKSRLGTRTRTSCSLGRAPPSTPRRVCLFIKMRKSHVYLCRDSTPITQEKLENDGAAVAGVRERNNRPDRVITKFRRGVLSLLAAVLAKKQSRSQLPTSTHTRIATIKRAPNQGSDEWGYILV